VGRAWLLRGLRAQGISAEDARSGLDLELPVEAELELARAALRGRLERGPDAAARSARFLVSRGFPPAIARKAVLSAREQKE
jgi:SOS response regulatory protein OraA/RecX